MPAGRQVLHLLPGDVELDAVLADSRYGADRDRHYLAAEHMSLLEEHVGDLMAAGVDDEPLDLPDVAVGGMDVFAAVHSHLSGGKGVVGDSGIVLLAGSSLPNSGMVQRSRIWPVAASTPARLTGTSRPWTWRSLTTRWVRVRARRLVIAPKTVAASPIRRECACAVDFAATVCDHLCGIVPRDDGVVCLAVKLGCATRRDSCGSVAQPNPS
jgi:hypothetical protein